MKIWDYLTLGSCSWFISCHVTLQSTKEKDLREKAHPIEQSLDDVDMIDSEDELEVIAKPTGKGKRKCASNTNEARTTAITQTLVVAHTRSAYGGTPSPSKHNPSISSIKFPYFGIQKTSRKNSEWCLPIHASWFNDAGEDFNMHNDGEWC